jgi:hypothetical protein
MKLNLTAEQISTIQYMPLEAAKAFALQILEEHSTHEKAVREKDPMKFVRLKMNIMSKRKTADIVKMFYDMYLAGEGLGVKGSKWKRHYNQYA